MGTVVCAVAVGRAAPPPAPGGGGVGAPGGVGHHAPPAAPKVDAAAVARRTVGQVQVAQSHRSRPGQDEDDAAVGGRGVVGVDRHRGRQPGGVGGGAVRGGLGQGEALVDGQTLEVGARGNVERVTRRGRGDGVADRAVLAGSAVDPDPGCELARAGVVALADRPDSVADVARGAAWAVVNRRRHGADGVVAAARVDEQPIGPEVVDAADAVLLDRGGEGESAAGQGGRVVAPDDQCMGLELRPGRQGDHRVAAIPVVGDGAAVEGGAGHPVEAHRPRSVVAGDHQADEPNRCALRRRVHGAALVSDVALEPSLRELERRAGCDEDAAAEHGLVASHGEAASTGAAGVDAAAVGVGEVVFEVTAADLVTLVVGNPVAG